MSWTFISRPLYLAERWLRVISSLQTVGVKALLVNHNSEVVLVRHTYLSGWHLPGGRVGRRESPLHAAVREAREEASVSVQPEACQLLGVYQNFEGGLNDHVCVFTASEFHQNPFLPSFEITEAKLFSIQQLPDGTTDATKRRIAEYVSSSRGLHAAW